MNSKMSNPYRKTHIALDYIVDLTRLDVYPVFQRKYTALILTNMHYSVLQCKGLVKPAIISFGLNPSHDSVVDLQEIGSTLLNKTGDYYNLYLTNAIIPVGDGASLEVHQAAKATDYMLRINFIGYGFPSIPTKSSKKEQHVCNCDMNTLLRTGCQCGGI
jgi:hypothetical protein